MHTAGHGQLITRALVVLNEHSSNVARMRRQIAELQLPVEVIRTERDMTRTQEALYATAREGDAILCAGGDGTTNHIAGMLLSPEGQARKLHLLPFVPLRGGNANDIAMMINGRKSAAQILQSGKRVDLYPLEVRVGGRNAYTRFALGYFSIGGTAEVSLRYEALKQSATPLKRATGVQLAKEVIATWVALSRNEPFELLLEGGEPENVTSYLLARGDRLAKLGRPHARLHEIGYETITTYPTGLNGTLVTLMRLQRSRLPGARDATERFTVRSKDKSPLPMQFDGEYAQIASGSNFTVSVSRTAYRTISTRL